MLGDRDSRGPDPEHIIRLTNNMLTDITRAQADPRKTCRRFRRAFPSVPVTCENIDGYSAMGIVSRDRE